MPVKRIGQKITNDCQRNPLKFFSQHDDYFPQRIFFSLKMTNCKRMVAVVKGSMFRKTLFEYCVQYGNTGCVVFKRGGGGYQQNMNIVFEIADLGHSLVLQNLAFYD